MILLPHSPASFDHGTSSASGKNNNTIINVITVLYNNIITDDPVIPPIPSYFDDIYKEPGNR